MKKLLISAVLASCCIGRAEAKGTTLVFEAPQERVYEQLAKVFYNDNVSYRITRKKDYFKAGMIGVSFKFYFKYDEQTKTTEVRHVMRGMGSSPADEKRYEEWALADAYAAILPREALKHKVAFVRNRAIEMKSIPAENAAKEDLQSRGKLSAQTLWMLLEADYYGNAQTARNRLAKHYDQDPVTAEDALQLGGKAALQNPDLQGALAVLREEMETLVRHAQRSQRTGTVRLGESSRTETAAEVPSATRYASDVDEPMPGAARERENDFALIVGIEKYQNVPDADHGQRDAEAIKKHIIRLGVPEENVILLTGRRATRTGITKYLEEWLPRNITSESRVYFYYSGHGAPDPERGTAYILPWDGDPSFLKSSGYPLAKLYASMSKLKSKENIVLLDACFSGAGGRSVIAKGMRPLVMEVQTSAPQSGRLSVLSAAAGSEVAGSLEEQGHGMFTYYLLKGLKGEADLNGDKQVTLRELHDYTLKEVRRAARRQNREQTPVFASPSPDLPLY
ncbi:MAG: caspase family protein [Elusimicrobiota bacterium]